MSRPGWRFLPVPALAACLGLGLSAGAGLPLAGFRASPWNISGFVGSARAAEAFLSVADDIPLMPGLSENTDAATVFDKPAGRIVTAEASGTVAIAAVKQFYAASLPQLGWQPDGDSRWRRDAEQLRFGYANAAGRLTVRFEILPIQ
jgi:hypothetical protein